MVTEGSSINPLTLLALSKLEANRDAISPGEYEGEELVLVSYRLKIGEDYSQIINPAVDWKGLFAFAMSKLNGVTVEAIVREFEAAGKIDSKAIVDRAQAAVETIREKGRRSCKGKVTGDVEVSKVRSGRRVEAA